MRKSGPLEAMSTLAQISQQPHHLLPSGSTSAVKNSKCFFHFPTFIFLLPGTYMGIFKFTPNIFIINITAIKHQNILSFTALMKLCKVYKNNVDRYFQSHTHTHTHTLTHTYTLTHTHTHTHSHTHTHTLTHTHTHTFNAIYLLSGN